MQGVIRPTCIHGKIRRLGDGLPELVKTNGDIQSLNDGLPAKHLLAQPAQKAAPRAQEAAASSSAPKSPPLKAPPPKPAPTVGQSRETDQIRHAQERRMYRDDGPFSSTRYDVEMRWQFAEGRPGSGIWSDFDDTHQAEMDQAFRNYVPTIFIGWRVGGVVNNRYEVSLTARTQTSMITGWSRAIRWTNAFGEDIRGRPDTTQHRVFDSAGPKARGKAGQPKPPSYPPPKGPPTEPDPRSGQTPRANYGS